MTTLAVQAHAQTYEDVKHLIYKIIHRFQQKHGGDWDDMLSVAHLAYVTTYDRWDRGIARFSTYLWNRVWGHLMMDMTKRIRRSQAIPTVDIPMRNEDESEGLSLDQVADKSPRAGFNFADYTSGLSDDVKEVIRLTLDVPAELVSLCKCKGEQAGDIRSLIRNRLEGIGWTFARVAESFAELRKVVTG